MRGEKFAAILVHPSRVLHPANQRKILPHLPPDENHTPAGICLTKNRTDTMMCHQHRHQNAKNSWCCYKNYLHIPLQLLATRTQGITGRYSK
jgi:hypothetical protein